MKKYLPNHLYFRLTLLALFSCSCAEVYAQPGNDACASAVTLTVGAGCVNGDITGGTTEGLSTPSCWGGNPSNYSTSVWYKFTATDDSITINFGGGTAVTSLLAVAYTSCAGTTEKGCGKGGGEIDLTGLTVGSTYYIMVDGTGTTVGTFCISVYETPPPLPIIGAAGNPRTLYTGADCNDQQGLQYDEANNMTSTSGGPDAGAATTGVCTLEQGCASTDVGQNCYWIDFTATAASQTIANAGTVGYNYSWYTSTSATCTTISSEIGCVTVAAGGSGSMTGLTSGTHYCVQITPSGTATASTAFMCLTGTIYTPPNDNCGSATSITTGTNYILNNSNATVDANNTLCSGSTENNIWVKWTADFTGTAYVNLQNQDCIAANGMQMSIFQAGASCPSSSTNCILYINPNNNKDFFGSFAAVSGSTYYIQLDGYAGTGCTFDFCITNSGSTSCALLLPINLTEFNARVKGETVNATWTTASELNNHFFTLERSIDGIDFETAATVPSNGNSTIPTNYSTNDYNPVKGISYYRLLQTDYNGTNSYSKTISVIYGDESDLFELRPNPATDLVNVTFNSVDGGPVLLKGYDITGRIIFTLKPEYQQGTNNITLDLSSYEKGIYFIALITNKKILQNKIIKK